MELDSVNRRREIPPDVVFYEALPYLYVGDARTLQSLPTLHVHQLTTIVIVRAHSADQTPYPATFQQSFKYYFVNSDSEGGLSLPARQCSQIVENERSRDGRKVLLVDEGGANRAAAIAVWYLIERHGLSLVRALEHMHICHPSLLLSSEHYKQCREFEIACQTTSSRASFQAIRPKRSLDEVAFNEDGSRSHKQPMLGTLARKTDEQGMLLAT